ncbi:pseudouridine synthase [Laribacter hongkongensis]|uniref:pseudouridine synthase n=1 Tax=Laribacter hongkongensis TaxID=168471 RepID=UPI001EFCFE22|nr:pseudouridine synthase [Laribacter hongkongensis]MCG9031107.1 pseudouridine synthase [Laribacter hongkongensis]MCG9091973.1 pseudouridine synthase [Laribacter hongkongensis]
MSKPKHSNQNTARQPVARTRRDQPQGGFGQSGSGDKRSFTPRGEGGYNRGPKPFGGNDERRGGDRGRFEPREGGGDRSRFDNREGGNRGRFDSRDSGDKRPFTPRGEGGYNRGPKPFGGNDERRGRFEPREGGGDRSRFENREGGNRGRFDSRDSGDKRPFTPRGEGGYNRGPKPFGGNDERRGGDRGRFEPREGGGDRSRFENREGGNRGRFDSRDGGDKRPFTPRGEGGYNRGPKPFGGNDERRGGDRGRFEPREGGGDRSRFDNREGGNRGRFDSRDGGDKRPFTPRGEGGYNRGPKPFGGNDERRGGDRGRFEPREGGGDRSRFDNREGGNRGRFDSRDGGDKRPFTPRGEGGDKRPFTPRGEGGKKPAAPVPLTSRAKRMPQRHLSDKIENKMQKLREQRIDPSVSLNEMRLQKALALAGLGSRRDMDELVAAGRVSINGAVAELGARVRPGDKVRVDSKPVLIRWPDRLPRVIVYHKQEGEIVTRDDPEGRTTVFDRLPQTRSSKWVAIGRLDVNTSGLLIFTTSGDLANRMTHPSFEVEREYAVRVLGKLTPEQMKETTAGVQLDDGPASFQFIREDDDKEDSVNHWYRVGIREGRNREVRRMFEHFGLTVSRLMRVRFGIVTLPSRLKRGQFYELNELEVSKLMHWSGLTMAGTRAD